MRKLRKPLWSSRNEPTEKDRRQDAIDGNETIAIFDTREEAEAFVRLMEQEAAGNA